MHAFAALWKRKQKQDLTSDFHDDELPAFRSL